MALPEAYLLPLARTWIRSHPDYGKAHQWRSTTRALAVEFKRLPPFDANPATFVNNVQTGTKQREADATKAETDFLNTVNRLTAVFFDAFGSPTPEPLGDLGPPLTRE